MQLVLGVQVGVGLGAAGAPLPAPPERWRLGERGRRTLRHAAWIVAFALLIALGAIQGATVAIGAHGVSDLADTAQREAAPAPRARAAREPGGAFWRPEQSRAQRPPPEIEPRRWKPALDD